MKDLSTMNFDTLTVQEFEQLLPELFAESGGNISSDPRFAGFLVENPVCADLVKDLETIASTAKSLFEPTHEPSDDVWKNIASKLNDAEAGESEED
jgi:hypothetical protein